MISVPQIVPYCLENNGFSPSWLVWCDALENLHRGTDLKVDVLQA